MQKMQIRPVRLEDSLEKEMATHSKALAWEIPRTEEPDGLQSMGRKRVKHDLESKQQIYTSILQCKAIKRGHRTYIHFS